MNTFAAFAVVSNIEKFRLALSGIPDAATIMKSYIFFGQDQFKIMLRFDLILYLTLRGESGVDKKLMISAFKRRRPRI